MTYATMYVYAFAAAIIGLSFNDALFQIISIIFFVFGFIEEKRGQDEYGFDTEEGGSSSPGDHGPGKGPLVPSA